MRTKSKPKALITATKEDYVRAIYILSIAEARVGVTDIAKRLKLSKSTVSERINELEEKGLVESQHYGQIQLTAKGIRIGKVLTSKHRIIEVFLHDILHVPKHRIHEEAEKLEHACSDDVIKRLARFLGNPKRDPHGSVIPQL